MTKLTIVNFSFQAKNINGEIYFQQRELVSFILQCSAESDGEARETLAVLANSLNKILSD